MQQEQLPQQQNLADIIAYPNKPTISGTVYDIDDALLSGVLVSCNNGNHTRTLETNGAGTYSFVLSADSSYKISCAKTGTCLYPDNRVHAYPGVNSSGNNFKALQNAITMNGYVKIAVSGVGLKGVNITVAGNPSMSTTTDDNGKYTFTALAGQAYTVTGTKTGWTIAGTGFPGYYNKCSNIDT